MESLIIQLGVKECLLLAGGREEKDLEGHKIRGILERCNVVATERKKSDYDSKNIAQDLNRLLEGDISVEALRKVYSDKYMYRSYTYVLVL